MGTIGLPDTIPNKYTGPEVNLVPIRFFPHQPVVANKKFPVGQMVILSKDPSTGTEGELWYLSKFSSGNPVWLPLTSGGSGPTITLSDTANTLVYPTAGGNIQLEGTAGISITSDAGNNKLVFALGGGGTAVDSFTVPSGTSPVVPDATGNITLTAGTGVTITGGLNTYEIGLSGAGVALDSITVDDFTGPGTNPVVPTAGGAITITGGQIANASLANVIKSNSLAANTFTIQIQQAATAAATDSTKNGVAHFDSNHFTIGANAFIGSQIATTAQIGIVTLATTAQCENGTYGTTQVVTAGDIDALLATPSTIGSGTRNTGAFSRLSVQKSAGGLSAITPAEFQGSSSNTLTVDTTLRLEQVTSGTAGTGYGCAMELRAQNASGTVRTQARLAGVYTDATDTSEDTKFRVILQEAGSEVNAAEIFPDKYRFAKDSIDITYGSGSPNGSITAAKGSLYLRTDGSSSSTRAYINTDGATAWTSITTAT